MTSDPRSYRKPVGYVIALLIAAFLTYVFGGYSK